MTTAATTAAVSMPIIESFDYSIIFADTAEQLCRSAASVSFYIRAELACPGRKRHDNEY